MQYIPHWASSGPFLQSRKPSQILDLSTHTPLAPSAWQNNFPTQSSSASKQIFYIHSINQACNTYINKQSIDKHRQSNNQNILFLLLFVVCNTYNMVVILHDPTTTFFGTLSGLAFVIWHSFGSLLHSANVGAIDNNFIILWPIAHTCHVALPGLTSWPQS